jgi:hypothetical protein
MNFSKELDFNGHRIKGWVCSCKEVYYDTDDAQRILLLNKLKKQAIKAKLGKIRSNLIIRLPKDIETVFSLEKGKSVNIQVEHDGFKIVM